MLNVNDDDNNTVRVSLTRQPIFILCSYPLWFRADWASARIVLGDPNFLKSLYEFDKDNVQESTMKKLRKYLENPKFTPEAVEKVSKVYSSFYSKTAFSWWLPFVIKFSILY